MIFKKQVAASSPFQSPTQKVTFGGAYTPDGAEYQSPHRGLKKGVNLSPHSSPAGDLILAETPTSKLIRASKTAGFTVSQDWAARVRGKLGDALRDATRARDNVQTIERLKMDLTDAKRELEESLRQQGVLEEAVCTNELDLIHYRAEVEAGARQIRVKSAALTKAFHDNESSEVRIGKLSDAVRDLMSERDKFKVLAERATNLSVIDEASRDEPLLKITQLEADLSASYSERQSLSARVQELTAQVAELNAKVKGLISTHTDEKAESAMETEELRNDLDAATQKLEASDRNLVRQSREAESLRRDRDVLLSTFRALNLDRGDIEALISQPGFPSGLGADLLRDQVSQPTRSVAGGHLDFGAPSSMREPVAAAALQHQTTPPPPGAQRGRVRGGRFGSRLGNTESSVILNDKV
jgi:uncharacterized coiled-coil DUF342 family protein